MITYLLAFLMGSSGMAAPPFLKAGGLEISKEGYNLILKHEVGGGNAYYTRFLQRPTVPGGASGITIGVGYDCGYNSRSQIYNDWKGKVAPDVLARLQNCAGKKGSSAKYYLPAVRNIIIPWDAAREVYNEKTIPRFAKLTVKAYPGIQKSHPHVQSALLSWVFNRGSGISRTSSRDREKRAMRADVGRGNWWGMPKHYRDSKRLWINKGLDGLLRRREDEAHLTESAL